MATTDLERAWFIEMEISRRLRELLWDVVQQACAVPGEEYLDSCAISIYADALRQLAQWGYCTIETDVGRRVIARPRKRDLLEEIAELIGDRKEET